MDAASSIVNSIISASFRFTRREQLVVGQAGILDGRFARWRANRPEHLHNTLTASGAGTTGGIRHVPPLWSREPPSSIGCSTVSVISSNKPDSVQRDPRVKIRLKKLLPFVDNSGLAFEILLPILSVFAPAEVNFATDSCSRTLDAMMGERSP